MRWRVPLVISDLHSSLSHHSAISDFTRKIAIPKKSGCVFLVSSDLKSVMEMDYDRSQVQPQTELVHHPKIKKST